MACEYIPQISIGFARTITSEVHDREFDAIEEALDCLKEEIDRLEMTDETEYDHGTVTDTYYIDPGLAINHKMLVEGDVELIIEEPEGTDPRQINLIIGDGGSGRFNFEQGTAWSSNAQGTTMDGKPYDSEGIGGAYGAIVVCLHDGLGWVHMVHARHDLPATTDTSDRYNWR